MKTLVILGSRNTSGQTARAAGALAEGVEGSVETVFLPQLDLKRCEQCDDDGWGTCRSEGRCKLDDDFEGLVGRVRDADLVVFATPVYFSDLSESMKAFLDRLRRICRFSDADGIRGKRAVGICMAGGGGGGAPRCASILDAILAKCGFDVVDMIPVRRQNLDLKIELLRATGRWLSAWQPS